MIKDRIVDSHSHERLLRKNDLTLEKTMKISKRAEVAKLQSEELCSVQFIYLCLKHTYMYTNNYKDAKEHI